MFTQAEITKPELIQVTISCTENLGGWKRLLEQLDSGKWPSCDLARQIRDVVRQAEQAFYSNQNENT